MRPTVFTGLLIALFIIGSATVAGAGLLYAGQRRRQLGGGDGDGETKLLTDGRGNLIERGIYDLRVGDVIQYDGADFLVEGVLEYDEDGRKWRSARIVDNDKTFWLVTGLGTQTSLRLLSNAAPDVEMSGYPPEKLNARGKRYSLDKRGTATAHFRGELGNMPGKRGTEVANSVDRCRWWRYEAPGEETLLVEQWGGEYRVLSGRHISDGVVEMIPGS